MNKPIRILIVEDHPIYREGLKISLSFSDLHCEVAATAASVKQAVEYIEGHPDGIDLVMLDFFLPDGNGRDVIEALKRHSPEAKVLVITSAVDSPEVTRLWNEGVDGIISKDVQSNEVSGIVTSVMNGQNQKEENPNDTPNPAIDSIVLTRRETEIVRLCAQGKNTKQIARDLFISPRTVERHKENVFLKLGINSSTDLMKFAIKRGLV